jgi:hypothetical protein
VLNERVAYMMIGTHSRQIEGLLLGSRLDQHQKAMTAASARAEA